MNYLQLQRIFYSLEQKSACCCCCGINNNTVEEIQNNFTEAR